MLEGPDLLRGDGVRAGRGPSRQALSMLDAKALIAEALVRLSTPIRTPTVRAAVFIPLYCGEWGQDLVNLVMTYKAQQGIGGLKHLKDALHSLAVEEFVKPGIFTGSGSK
jgi:hypothetical protein